MRVSRSLFPFPLHVDHQSVEVAITSGSEVNFINVVLGTDRPRFIYAVVELQPVTPAVGATTAEVGVCKHSEHGVCFSVCIDVGKLYLAAILGLANLGAQQPACIIVRRITVIDVVEEHKRRPVADIEGCLRKSLSQVVVVNKHANRVGRGTAGGPTGLNRRISEKVVRIGRVTEIRRGAFCGYRVVTDAASQHRIADIEARADLTTPAKIVVTLLAVTLEIGTDRAHKKSVALILQCQTFRRPVTIPDERLTTHPRERVLEFASKQMQAVSRLPVDVGQIQIHLFR